MTKLYLIEPEVAGGFGPKTIITNHEEVKLGQAKIKNVLFLEYVFDDWLGDDLINSHACFIVSPELANKIKSENLTGYSFSEVLISKSDLFRQIHEVNDLVLPDFLRLIPEGSASLDESEVVIDWSGHDFCLSERGRLIVTEKCLDVLKQFKTEQSDIRELNFERKS